MLSNLVRNRHGYLSVRRLQSHLSTARGDWADFEQPPKRERQILSVLPVLKCQREQSSCGQRFGEQPMGDASTVWFSSRVFSNREQRWQVLRIEKCSATNSEKHVIAEVSQSPETVSVLFSLRESKQNVLIVICISRRKNERRLFEKTTVKQSCKPEGKEKQPQIYYLHYNIVSMT